MKNKEMLIGGFDVADPRLSPTKLARDLVEFKGSMADLRENNLETSPTLVHFAEAAMLDLDDQTGNFPDLLDITRNFIMNRPNLDVASKKELFWRAFHHEVFSSPDYSNEFSVAEWQDTFRGLLRDPMKRHEIEDRLSSWNNQANEPRRYAGLKLAALLLKDSLPDKPSIIDAGASAALGELQLIHNVPFEGVKFNAPDPIKRKLIGMLSADLALDRYVSFDSLPVDHGSLPWIESNSITPAELHDKHRIQKRLDLYGLRKFGNPLPLHANFAYEYGGYMDTVRNTSSDGTYDIGAALTVFYMLSPRERAIADEHMKSLTSVFEYRQDYVVANGKKLEFPGIYKAPYRGVYRFRDDPKQLWHELGTWDNGRSREFTPSEETSRLALAT